MTVEPLPQPASDVHSGLLGGILVGGGSRRMGRPKQLVEIGNQTMFERVADALAPHVAAIVALGAGELPAGWDPARRLADAPGVRGPVAGILSALQWAPQATWVVAACDLPDVTPAAIAWLLTQRRPNRAAVLPCLDTRGPEPLLALYEPAALPLIEQAASSGAGPASLAGHAAVAVVPVPAPLRQAWWDADTPTDLATRYPR